MAEDDGKIKITNPGRSLVITMDPFAFETKWSKRGWRRVTEAEARRIAAQQRADEAAVIEKVRNAP